MAELKTKKNDSSVEGFLNSVEHDKKRADSFRILEMMKEITGENPKMWGDSLIGFGTSKYRYASGEEGEWFKVGFSPRKQNLSLYLWGMYFHLDSEDYKQLMNRLGKHKVGKSCVYINKLEDVDWDVLQDLIRLSLSHL
jgi:hypothetical protein